MVSLASNRLTPVGLSPTSGNAENLTQYDPAVERDIKNPCLTFVLTP